MEEYVHYVQAQQLLRAANIRVSSVEHDNTKHTLIKKLLSLANEPPTAEQILWLRFMHRRLGMASPQATDFTNRTTAGNIISARWPPGMQADIDFFTEAGAVLPPGTQPVVAT